MSGLYEPGTIPILQGGSYDDQYSASTSEGVGVILHLQTVLMWSALSQLPWQQVPRLVLPTGQQTTCELEHNETRLSATVLLFCRCEEGAGGVAGGGWRGPPPFCLRTNQAAPRSARR